MLANVSWQFPSPLASIKSLHVQLPKMLKISFNFVYGSGSKAFPSISGYFIGDACNCDKFPLNCVLVTIVFESV